MKKLSLLLTLLIMGAVALAQRPVQMSNLWTRPQVHVLFQGYVVSFAIRDIDRALQLLEESGDSTYGSSCKLDTAGNYVVELFPGFRQEYKSRMQPLMQRGVGAFLMLAGRAYIEDRHHHPVTTVTADIAPFMEGVEQTNCCFYDPATNIKLFEGKFALGMQNRDLGIDY